MPDIYAIMAQLSKSIPVPAALLSPQVEKPAKAPAVIPDTTEQEIEAFLAEVEIEPPYSGPITECVYLGKGSTLSMWNASGMITVSIQNLHGDRYFGRLCGSIAAEGALSPNSDEDRAWMAMAYDTTLRDLHHMKSSASDRNYTHVATALWDNRACEGKPVSRAIMLLFWGEHNGGQYPQEAVILDGKKSHVVPIERQRTTTVNQPHWKGTLA